MRLEPLPLKLSTLRWIMIRIAWKRGSWTDRVFQILEIWLTLRRRVPPGNVSIIGLWSEMSRYAPRGRRDEKTFLEFCSSLPGGESFSEVIAQRILDEIERRKEVQIYGPGGTHLRLMDVSDVVARDFAGLLRFAIYR